MRIDSSISFSIMAYPLPGADVRPRSSPAASRPSPAWNFRPPAPSIPDSPGHIREFLNAIKSREKPTCNVDYGHRLTKGGLLANIAYRTRERLHWDDEHERFTGRTDANRYVTRLYRRPWRLDTKL